MHNLPPFLKHLQTQLSLILIDLALEVELRLAIGGERAPGGLVGGFSVVANGGRLPWLIKGLEVESVETPVKEGAEAVLEEMGGVVFSTLGSVEVSAN